MICRLIDKTIIRAAEKDDAKTNESTIKTAAPRGALRVFCNLISGFIHITSEVVLVKVYVRGQGNMTILETGEYIKQLFRISCFSYSLAAFGIAFFTALWRLAFALICVPSTKTASGVRYSCFSTSLRIHSNTRLIVSSVKLCLRQHRTELVVQMRSQIFRQIV